MPTIPPSPRRRRRRAALVPLLLALVVGVGGWLWWPADAGDHAAWRADLADLERHTAVAYANLEWFVRSGTVDPQALHDSTVAALDRARTPREARRALVAFAAAFHDGHFHVRRPTPALVVEAERLWQRRDTPPPRDWPAERACTALGYRADARGFGLPLERLDGFVALPDAGDGFPAGVLPLPDGRRAGVLRIDLFSTYAHRSACARAWERLRDTLSAPCGERCAEAVDSMAAVVLLDRLAARAGALAAAGADLLVVDLTGNGGGEDVVDPMARTLTATRLRANPVALLRHPHVTAQLEEARAALTEDLARGDLPAEQRALLAGGVGRLDTLLAETRRPCDWSGIWRAGAASAACAMLVHGGTYATGLLDYAAPGALAGLASRWVLFGPGRFTYREGAWTGPLVVLVDRRTASASELFTALLRDNGAARVVGERTWGAGCGYTNGGIRHRLAHTGLDVQLPDCVRLRADGSNEVAGIRPDVEAGWQPGDDDLARAAKARAALANLASLGLSGSPGRTAPAARPGR
ncbi:MAG TPA: S41 family peptidase [Gemmatimonadales bacterium]|nr:S41 family peptidase [Gemmatimonadales bacterium]